MDKAELLTCIETLRKEMIRVGIQEGLTSKNTIKISRKLDIYIEISRINIKLVATLVTHFLTGNINFHSR